MKVSLHMRNNMKIDLTPLLDVMMIIIFAVLICISTASLLTFISFQSAYLLHKVGLALKVNTGIYRKSATIRKLKETTLPNRLKGRQQLFIDMHIHWFGRLLRI